jgi:hypothetical protein
MRIVHYRTQGTRTWFALVRLALVVTAGLSGFITVCALIAMVGCFWATLVSAIRAYDHCCCRVWNTVNQFILLAGITTTSRFGQCVKLIKWKAYHPLCWQVLAMPFLWLYGRTIDNPLFPAMATHFRILRGVTCQHKPGFVPTMFAIHLI